MNRLDEHLINAIKTNNLILVKLLIDEGADYDARYLPWWKAVTPDFLSNHYYLDYTPLMIASKLGYLDIVRYLIEMGADVNAKTYDNMTALEIATTNNQVEILTELYEHPQIELTQRILKCLAEANATIQTLTLSTHHRIDLANSHILLTYREMFYITKTSHIQFLINMGANVNAIDNLGNSVLTHALINYANWKTILALIEAGADVNYINDDKTPIDFLLYVDNQNLIDYAQLAISNLKILLMYEATFNIELLNHTPREVRAFLKEEYLARVPPYREILNSEPSAIFRSDLKCVFYWLDYYSLLTQENCQLLAAHPFFASDLINYLANLWITKPTQNNINVLYNNLTARKITFLSADSNKLSLIKNEATKLPICHFFKNSHFDKNLINPIFEYAGLKHEGKLLDNNI